MHGIIFLLPDLCLEYFDLLRNSVLDSRLPFAGSFVKDTLMDPRVLY